VSSAPRRVFRFATCLTPPDLSPTLPPTMVPSSACLLTASPGCRWSACCVSDCETNKTNSKTNFEWAS